MKVVVTIPWRESPDRLKWLDVVKKHYAAHFPGVLVAVIDSDASKPFNRSQARNNCVAYAVDKGATVVVINDADTLVRSTALKEAISDASDGRLHLPFTTIQVFSGEPAHSFAANVSFPTTGGFESTGGIYVCTPQAWEAMGGADEAFEGWGGEDDAIVAMASTTCGLVRHLGVGVSLGHDAERLVNPNYAKNMQRAQAYKDFAARKTPWASLVDFRHNIERYMCQKSQARVLVVVPSRGRPGNVARLIESVQSTSFCHVSVVVGLDEDDAHNYRSISTKCCESDAPATFVMQPRQRLNAWWNQLAVHYIDSFDYMLFAGDDNVFVTPGWDWLLVNELRQHNDAGFATGPDMLRKDRNFTWAMMSTEQLKRVGYVGPPDLTHLCIDTAWQKVARETGTMWWVDAAVIEHRHYARTDVAVAKDRTYADANAPEMYRRDHEAVDRWWRSPEFTRYCKIVSGLLEHGAELQDIPPQPDEEFIEINLGGKQVFSGTLKELLEKLACE